MVTMYFDRDEERRALGLDAEKVEQGRLRQVAMEAARKEDEGAQNTSYPRLCTVFAQSFMQRTACSLSPKRNVYRGKAAAIMVECLDLDRDNPLVELRKFDNNGKAALSVWALHRIRGWIQIYPLAL